jgi:transcriptional regulator with XRE-family HTH domain
MSQETLANRAGLDRTYISNVERGERNISIINIQKISAALLVSVEYLFSSEVFTTASTVQQMDSTIPFKQRFQYHLDQNKRVLAFQVHGILTGENVDYMSRILLGICNAFGMGELNVLVDHRDLKDANGEVVVYSPEVAERAVLFQQELLVYSKKVVALCNSEFMVQNLNHVAQSSGIIQKATHLFGKDKDMVGQAYEMLEINGNDLIKPK